MVLRCQLPVGLHHGLDGEQLTADVEQNVVHVLHLVLETLEIWHSYLIPDMVATIQYTVIQVIRINVNFEYMTMEIVQS